MGCAAGLMARCFLPWARGGERMRARRRGNEVAACLGEHVCGEETGGVARGRGGCAGCVLVEVPVGAAASALPRRFAGRWMQ